MDSKDILVIGTNGSVIAFRRDTGQKLWSVHLKGSDFVTLVTDEKRVYAHTRGELFCVDLFTGEGVWSDGLKGFGYNLASIVLPGSASSNVAASMEHRRQQEAASNASVHTSTTS